MNPHDDAVPETDDDSAVDPASDDDALGRALGDAIDHHVRDAHVAPPLASIEARAAARARARQVRRVIGSVAASVALIFGGVVVYNASRDDAVTTSTAAAEDTLDAAADGTPQADAPSATDMESDGDPADPGDATTADPGSAQPDGAELTPADLSTGPVLDWVEVAPLAGAVSVHPTGDGRVYARSFEGNGMQLRVTADGVTWDSLPTPRLDRVDLVDLSGDTWLITGWDRDAGEMLLWSDDGGATWNTLATGFGELEPLESPYLASSEFVAAVAASGGRILVATQTFVDFDVAALLVDLGVADSQEDLFGFGWGSGVIEAEVGDAASPRQVVITYEEAGLDAETTEFLEQGDRGAIHLYMSEGASLDFVAEFEGGGPQALPSDDGFTLSFFGVDGRTLVTSPDGVDWTEISVSPFGELAAGPDGALWEAAWDDGTFAVRRSTDAGRTFSAVASWPALRPAGGIHVGEAGVVTTVYPVSGQFPAGDPNEGGLAMFDGAVIERDGYELRYNVPEGGISLWDVAAGEAVVVFEDVVGGNDPPAGVTEIDDGDGFRLIFEDPETGEPLVTFTEEDFAQLDDYFAEGVGSASEMAPLEDEFGEPVPLEFPEIWIGWSADGAEWGWQSLEEAFSVEASDVWAQIAVGDGFVVARVEPSGFFATDEPEEVQTSFPEASWFVATVG